jgi:hypothetical protein
MWIAVDGGALAVHIGCMARMSLTMTEPQLVWLRREAKKLGITVADLIRRIIDQNRVEQR